MYLKEISASGFKSFADKITLSLDGKTTCIVGPNGSGKSNIVDAVRWVLGEQSVKSLRGDGSMSDVIFSGSKNRNALNVATVSLTFDNSDNYINLPYNEITIKRRVYRTGENEYFINNTKSRLKDVIELFLDSGIGKSSFNIISQGEVQKILSDSSYDRRVIFESAAGVLKYKKRKEESIKKLEKTHNNLDRVNDILRELEVQLEPLKDQSIKASKYLELKEQLENIEVALLAEEITNINSLYQKSKEKIEKLNEEIMNLGIKTNKRDSELIEAKTSLTKNEVEIKKLNDELLALTQKEESLNGEKKLLQERSKYDASNNKVHENITTLKEKQLKLKNNIYLNNIDVDNILSEISLLNESLSRDNIELENQNILSKRLYSELNSKKIEISDIKHKISITNDFINNGGGFNNAVKAVLNNPRLNGIHSTIGNLIDVDSMHVKALDIALASSKQFIVVDNENNAKEAIGYLKDNKIGRATFFPINIIKPRGIDLETQSILEKDDGYLNTMSNVVKFDKKYYNIVSNQLGNIILSKDIDSANRISKKINQKYKIVTLDGDVVHVGGSISGGSLSNVKSIFKEKQELELLINREKELIDIIKEIEINIDEVNSKKDFVEKSCNDKHISLVTKQQILLQKKEILENLNKELEQVENELRSLSNVINSSISKEEDRIINEYYEVSRKKEETIKLISKLQKEKDSLNYIIDEIESSNKLSNSSLSSYEKELKQCEIDVSKMDIKLDNFLNILNEEYELTYERAKENYNLEIDIETARKEVISLKNGIKNIGMVNIASIEDYKKVSERFEFLNSQKNDLLNAQDTLLEIIEEMDSVMKEEFKTTFDKIKVEFETVFKQLFKGGSATLKLTDPKDLLETGVDIIASPPGKKLTSINLLSGGEKTLTAICLIFAILNVKTIPFCLFDEVEAALDEANVDNFGKYLNNYRDKTQFLIITHKKKTMEYANCLYGITMQESGVSKLVSVKLENINS